MEGAGLRRMVGCRACELPPSRYPHFRRPAMVKLFANAIVFSAGFAAGMLVRRPESRTGAGDDTSDEASARPAPRRGFTPLHEGRRSRDLSASRPADGSPSASGGRLLEESP